MDYKISCYIPGRGWTFNIPVSACTDAGAKRAAFRAAKAQGAIEVALWRRVNALYVFSLTASRDMRATRWEDAE